MAEENITQLSAAMLKLQEDIAKLGYVTQASAEQLKDAQMKAKYGSESYTKGVNAAGQALGALAGAGIEGAKAMYQGKKDATALNGALGELSKAAALAATALTFLLPGGAIIKGVAAAFALFTSATVGIVQAANEMNAKLFKSYEGLQKAGGAASDGMTGVFKDAKKLGLSMDELDSMVGLVAENSQELALLTGSVADGRKKFADMGEALESSRVGFFALGISQQEQNETIMRYTKNMTLSGRAQNMTTKELAEGARSYIYEQDRLTKLTGLNAKAQQTLLDRARDSEQFNSKIRALEMENTVESRKAADGLREGLKIAAMGGEKTAAGFMAIVNNNLVSADAQALFMTSYGKAMQAPLDIIAGMDPAKALQPMFDGIAEFERTQGNMMSSLEAGNGRFLKSSEQANASMISSLGIEKASAKLRADQDKTAQLQGDAITAQEARHMKERQDLNKKAEENMFKTIASAQTVNDKMLGATNVLIDLFGKLAEGIRRLLNILPGGSKSSEPPPPPKMGSYNRMPGASPTSGGATPGGTTAAGSAPAARSASVPEQHSSTGGGGAGSNVALTQVSSKTGKTASVNKEYASRFQGIIDYLDGVGYEIYSLGGYVDRDVRNQPGVKSVHAKGGAIDINPRDNPYGSQLITDMPPEIGKVASDMGLGWGGNWKSVKDAMHFSVAEREGGSIKLSEGGVAVGPNSGYPATLHGEEAVIPLNNGGGNFVKIFEDMAMMMGKQTGAMDELIRVAKNGNDIQTKILRQQA